MATLKKRILKNISQSETGLSISEVTNPTTTLILENKTEPIPPSIHKVRLVEVKTTYPRFTDFAKRLKTLKTLREYNEILGEFTDRLSLFRNCIDDCTT